MRKLLIVLGITALLVLASCSPRDFLTRRLAADLIASSEAFRDPQQFQVRTGVLSNDDYLSPEYRMLEHRGWMTSPKVPCPAALSPPPCWDFTLTPFGVDTFQSLIAPGDSEKQSFSIPAARRELVEITGIAKQGNVADIEFLWKWVPLNEVGAMIYHTDLRYRSTASFRRYDDGWRVVLTTSHNGQPLDEALKDAETVQ
jgi:hypothetical protein